MKLYKRRKLAVNLAILFFAAAFALFSLEVFCRYFQNSFLGARSSESFSEQINNQDFVPSQILGYEPHKNSFNTRGIYGFQSIDEYTLEKKENAFRIAVIGDSIIQYEYISEALKEFLKNSKKYKYEIWNMGAGGYNTIQECIFIKKRCLLINPDLIILGYCLNDVFNSLVVLPRKQGYEMRDCNFEPLAYYNPLLFKQSALYRFIFLKTVNIKRYYDIRSGLRINSKQTMESFLLDASKRLEKKNIPFVVLILPMLHSIDEYNDWEKYSYNAILQIVEKNNLRYLDTTKELNKMDFLKLRCLPDDATHPNKKTSYIIAKFLLKFLKQNFSQNF